MGTFEAWWDSQTTKREEDGEAMRALFSAIEGFSGAVQALKTTRVPYLLYAGTEDIGPYRHLQPFEAKYGGRHFYLEGKNHSTSFRESASEVVPQITAFIDEVEAARAG